MSDLGVILLDVVVGNRREGEVFRKGRVTAVDDTLTPNRITVAAGGISRIMPILQVGVTVGSVVIFADQDDPFALGKLSGT